MPKKQHTCAEVEVQVKVGEEFEWTTTAEYCDIHIIDDHPLDQDDYHIVKGTPTPAKVKGRPGEYKTKCECKEKGHPDHVTNPKIIIS